MKLAMKLMIGSCAMLIFVLIFGFVVFPKMIKGKIKKMTAVVPGSDMREMFIKVPFGLDIKIYLFNVTNPMQVQKGEKPNLVEIGPFCYSKVDVGNIVSLMEYSTAVSIHIALVRTSSPTDLTNFQHPIYLFLDGSRQKNEWKEKVEISDNENDDTMSYKPMDTYFEENGSGCLSGQEVITVLHPLIVGMINTVSRTKPAMLSLINKAVNAIYRQPTSIYLEAKATDILFNGVIIDCNVQEFAAKAVCSQLQQSPDLRHISDNEFGFSLIGPKNATPGKVFRVYRGKKKSRDLGKIVEFDGKKSMETWPTKDCNKLRGTDGTIFPPFLNKKDGLVSFSPDLCRSLVARFEKSTEYNGIPVWAYTASLGDMSKNADEKCFCPTNDTCLKKGLMDLFKCVGVPLYVSLPHFYDSDIMYLTGVSGLNPKKEKHGIEILFEHMTGGPVSARKRLQFNMPLEPNAKVALFNDLPTVIHPIFWIEEGVSLNDTFTKPIKGLFRILKIFKIFKWILLLASLVGISASAYMMYKNTGTVSISPVHQVKPSDRISPISRIHGEFIAHNNNETKHVENGRY